MNVGPVYWGSYNGEMLEKVMAVLVAQDYRGVIRRTPASGDGGVDILIPDGEGWHVRQVKGYTGRVSERRRTEIEKSFKTLCDDPRLEKPITRWTLTVPIDPTPDEQKWFENLTLDAPFPCGWDGEVFWHGLAANHPHVIDYYLRDGRSRVESRAQMLLKTSSAVSNPLSANDVAGHLELLRASLNREDPHYKYEFVTGPAARDSAAPGGCVIAVTTQTDDSELMIQVFPKHEYALEDAPIEGKMNITIFNTFQGIDIRDEFESFRTFGTAIELPEGTLEGTFVAPGGLGGEIHGGGGRIGPNLISDPPPRTRIRLVHPEEGAAIEVGLDTKTATRGDVGGIEIRATDQHGVLDVSFRVHPPDSDPPLTFNLTTSGLAGRPIQEVIPATRLLGSLKPPMRFEWLMPFGNQVLAAQNLTEDLALLSAGEVALFDDLSAIQDHVRETVTVPEEIPPEAVDVIRRTAHLIRQRETSGTWTELTVGLREGVSRDEVTARVQGESTLAVQQDQVLQLDDNSYELGTVHYFYASARLANPQPDDPRKIRLIPGSDNTMKQALGPLANHS